MKIALVGYGKMGQRIHSLAKVGAHQVDVVVIGKINAGGMALTASRLAGIDVAIEFTRPDSAEVNLRKLIELGMTVVCGTTGWLTDALRHEMTGLCKASGARVLYGSNFSLGVQLFLKLVQRSGELIGANSAFSAGIHEVHHVQKADAPSGTAITAAQLWLRARVVSLEATTNGADAGAGASAGAGAGASASAGVGASDTNSAGANDGDAAYSYGIPSEGKPDPNRFYVTSQRLEGVYGEHELRIRTVYDDIRIRHEALSRDGFATGALQSAEWLQAQDPGFYLIEDVVASVISSI